MYPTALVRQLIVHFADLAGWDGRRYYVTLDRRRFDRACRRFRLPPSDEHGGDFLYGSTIVCAYSREPDDSPLPLTWINPETNRTVARLIRTCAHEALHAARPNAPHGRAFEKAVTRLTRGQEP